VEQGLITSIGFYGDFLAISSLRPLTLALEGCPFRREAVASVLERFPLEELFGTITEDEVLDTIFYAGDQ
jgi:lipoate-protein ligase A